MIKKKYEYKINIIIILNYSHHDVGYIYLYFKYVNLLFKLLDKLFNILIKQIRHIIIIEY